MTKYAGFSVAAALAMAGLAAACTPTSQAGLASAGEQPMAAQHAEPSGVRFAIIGDTGVLPPEGNLAMTSQALASLCGQQGGCDFVLMSGDNIYPKGATGDPAVDAPVFDTLFTRPFARFAQENPDAPIAVALGNHDWYTSREGAQAQVDFHASHAPFFMDSFFYTKRLTDAAGGVDLFVIDTEMLLSTRMLGKYDRAPDGAMQPNGKTGRGGTSNAQPQTDREKQQLEWFASAMAASDARWKLVLAHHPLWQGRSDSKFTQSIVLRDLLLPTLCQYADGYFAGHQHTVEIFSDDCQAQTGGGAAGELPVVVSGAGAKAREIDQPFIAWQAAAYPQSRNYLSWGDTPGVVMARIDGDKLVVEPVRLDENGAVVTRESFSFSHRSR